MIKKILLLAAGVVALLLLSALAVPAKAIPNPAPIFCSEMGYTIKDDKCVFPNGQSCNVSDFYNKKCGTEFIKNLSCVQSGDTLNPGHSCCDGLTAVSQSFSSGGLCVASMGLFSKCATCGNGVCDASIENACNCPSDCKAAQPTQTSRALITPRLMCNIIYCEGGSAIYTGKNDSGGCPIYVCPGESVEPTVTPKFSLVPQQVCNVMVLEGARFTGKSDSNGCPIYEYPTPTVCAVPNCVNRKDTGNKDAYGCVIYSCATETCPAGCSCNNGKTTCASIEKPVKTKVTTQSNKTVPVVITKTADGKTEIVTDKATAKVPDSLKVENGTVVVKTSAGTQVVAILPDEARQKAGITNVTEINLVEQNQRQVYQIIGTTSAKLFRLIPVTLQVTSVIDAISGETVSAKGPWWQIFTKK